LREVNCSTEDIYHTHITLPILSLCKYSNIFVSPLLLQSFHYFNLSNNHFKSLVLKPDIMQACYNMQVSMRHAPLCLECSSNISNNVGRNWSRFM